MHRTDDDANVANKFDPGDPDVPRQPTLVSADWLNAVQEELCNAIENAGVTLVKGTWTQLQSIMANLSTTQTFTGTKTFNGGVVVTRPDDTAGVPAQFLGQNEGMTQPAFEGAYFKGGDGGGTGGGADGATFEGGDGDGSPGGHGITAKGGPGSVEGAGVNALARTNATGAAPTVAARCGNGNFKMAGAVPNSDADFGTNTLTPGLIPKAWGHLSFAGGVLTVVAGQNISSAAFSGTNIAVTLVNPIASNNQCILVTGDVGTSKYSVANFTAHPFSIQEYDASNSVVNLSAATGRISFVVFGVQ